MARIALFALVETAGFALMVAWVIQRQAAYGLALFWAALALIVVGNAGLLITVLGRVQRAGRIKAGLCPACGRDRKGATGACPNCGAIGG